MTTYFTTQRLYWVATGLFLALFIGSVILGLADINESYKEFVHLEFPAWSFIALTVAKVLGLIAIITNKSQTLKDFAFAGFLYDLLLALGGHIAHQEIKALLAVFGLVLWIFAFVMDRKFFAAQTLRP
jgi:tellurite resistance protein TehA-like permease